MFRLNLNQSRWCGKPVNQSFWYTKQIFSVWDFSGIFVFLTLSLSHDIKIWEIFMANHKFTRMAKRTSNIECWGCTLLSFTAFGNINHYNHVGNHFPVFTKLCMHTICDPVIQYLHLQVYTEWKCTHMYIRLKDTYIS